VRKNKQTLILVTHEQDIAKYADKIIHITDGSIDSIIINDNRQQDIEHTNLLYNT